MSRHPRAVSQNRRRGLTLVELLVIILIVGLLTTLIVFKIESSWQTARKAQCLNNMKKIYEAMTTGPGSSRSLPPLVSDSTIANSAGAQGKMNRPWTIFLLPNLDKFALFNSIRNDAVISNGLASINLAPGFQNVAIDVFACPANVNVYGKPGGLSFVVNAGHMPAALWGNGDGLNFPYSIGWSGTGEQGKDVPIGLATGVIWPSTDGTHFFSSSVDYASTGDGADSTILLSENLQAGTWYGSRTPGTSTFGGTNALGFGIGFTESDLKSAFPNAGDNAKIEKPEIGASSKLGMASSDPSDSDNRQFENSPPSRSATPSLDRFENKHRHLEIGTPPDSQKWFINRNLSAARGTAPRPSSYHAGGVNVMMCDWSGRFLSERMNEIVYMKLMTSNGVFYGEQELKQDEF